MKLQFDTIHDGEPEAAIILVALAALHPGAVSVLNINTPAPTFASMAAAHAAADNGYAERPIASPPELGAPFLPPEPDAAAVFAAPQAPAPATDVTAAGAPSPATAGGLGPIDKAGWPWDKRIHATGGDGAGVLTEKGVWRPKRGVASDLVASVQAALRAQGYGVAPTEAAVTQAYMAAAEAPPPPPPAAATPPPPPAAATPPPPPAATAPPPPAAAAPLPGGASSIAEFGRIMTKATNAQKEGKTTVEATLGLVQSLGMTSMADLIAQPQHMPTFEAMLDASIAAAG